MKHQLSVKIILLCIGFLLCSNARSQTMTISDMVKMTGLSKDDMVKYLQKNYTYVNKVLPDSVSDTWRCTKLSYGGTSFYSYTREINDNRTSIILSMTYKNLFDKLEEEIKGMKFAKAPDGVYENDKYLIYPQKMYSAKGPDTYIIRVEAK